MNVLMTVISLLMVLTILTTARMDSFVTNSLLRSEAHLAMNSYEKEWRYRAARTAYERAGSKSSGKNEEKETEEQAPAKLNRFFSLKALLANGDDEAMRRLFKRLIHEVYKEQAFYRAFIADDNEEEVLEKLLNGILDHSSEKRISQKRQLAEIYFSELKYQNAFAKMLNGRPQIGTSKGYPSLLSLVTTQRKEMRISLYLAERPLLMALLGNAESVYAVMQVRQEIYRDLVNGHIEPKEGAQRLQAVVTGSDFPDFIDFSVSKTRPPKL